MPALPPVRVAWAAALGGSETHHSQNQL